MKSSSSNEPRGFLFRALCSFTGQITHPYVAWTLFVLLCITNLLYFWIIPMFLEATTESLLLRKEFDIQLLNILNEIKDLLVNTLAVSNSCQ